MKKLKNTVYYLLVAVLIASMTITFVGCSVKDAEEEVTKLEDEATSEFEKLEGEVDEIIAAAKDEFEKWDTEAQEAVASAEEVTEDDIHEAINYIDENIATPFKNGEVTKKLAEYAAKLKYLGEKDATLVDHEITKLGQNVYDYLHKVIVEGEELESETVNTIKTDIDKGLTTIKNDKDTLVSEFHSLINK